MYLFNISYVVPARRADSFLSWARSEAKIEAASPLLRHADFIKVAAVPGDPEFTRQPDRNYSLQFSFDSLSDCRKWHESRFQPLMDSYAEWHGPNPLFFASILLRDEL